MSRACLLSELIEEYCKALQQEKPASEETRRRYRDPLEIMVSLMGDREAGSCTRQDLLALRTKLLRWPANLNRLVEFSGKPAEEILRLNRGKCLDKRTVDTRYMDKILAVFQYAFRQGIVEGDISQSVVKTVTVAEKKSARRKPYDIEDLKKIFARLPVHPERPHMAWIPLIGAFSGARLGELCGLKTADFSLYRRIPYMLLTEEDDSGRIVTDARGVASRRLVPLHPLLVEMGLLQFVAMRKARGRELLFELAGKGGDEYLPLTSDYFARSFEAFTRKNVTHDLRKSFYSFRYNLHQALALKKTPPELCFSITGHTPQFESEQITPGESRLSDKYKALVQLAYPGVELAEFKEKLSALVAPR